MKNIIANVLVVAVGGALYFFPYSSFATANTGKVLFLGITLLLCAEGFSTWIVLFIKKNDETLHFVNDSLYSLTFSFA